MTHASLQEKVVRLDSAIHHGALRAGKAVDMLVMHTTDGDSAQSSIDYLNTTADKTASYHYVVDHDGTMYRMTNPSLVAYHAGDSGWPFPKAATPENPDRPNGGGSVNRRSIGIAWADKGRPLTDAQLESGLWLAGTLCQEYEIAVEMVLGHLEVSPGRKFDPHPEEIEIAEFRAMLANWLRT